MARTWQEALLTLHVGGWDTDDIDDACETLAEACDEGILGANEVVDLDADDVRSVLDNELSVEEADALILIADLRQQVGGDAEALGDALYDLDAFAYEYSDED